jgi:hypothetical protein
MRKLWLAMSVGTMMASALLAQDTGIRGWQKYIAPDRSLSFHYPKGWTVKTDGPMVDISNGDEQLLLIAMPADARKTAQQVAKEAVEVFKKDMPDLTPSDWRTEPGNQLVYFRSSYTQSGTRFAADALVLKQTGKELAVWLSFSAPQKGYVQGRAANILQAVLGSFESGTGSQPPIAAPSPAALPEANRQRVARMAENCQAFLFMIEFGIGAPLTAEQERIIGDELRSGWARQADAELAKFDAYPQSARTIMHGNPSKVEELRKTIESAMREWLDQFPNDPGAKAIRAAIASRGRVIVEAAQPLTAMAAQSVAEMLAYSQVLASNPGAMPSDVPANAVAEQKQRVIAAWKSLPAEIRTSIAGVPGLWVTTRALLNYGDADDQAKARERILRMTENSQPAAPQSSGSASTKAIDELLQHNSLMMVQQQTFNMYMWSRGFNYTATGRMW